MIEHPAKDGAQYGNALTFTPDGPGNTSGCPLTGPAISRLSTHCSALLAPGAK